MRINATSNEVAHLVEVLERTPKGGMATNDDFSKAIGRDISACRYLLVRARVIVNRDHGMTFEAIHGKGLRRQTSDQIYQVGQKARKGILGKAKNAYSMISNAASKTNDLSNEQRLRLLAEQSVLGLIQMASREKSLPKVNPEATKPMTYVAAAQELLRHLGATTNE